MCFGTLMLTCSDVGPAVFQIEGKRLLCIDGSALRFSSNVRKMDGWMEILALNS